MKRKIFEDCVVTIENAKTKKVIWLEETTDDSGRTVAYTIKKQITDRIGGRTTSYDIPCGSKRGLKH
jgi:hypothetical protein